MARSKDPREKTRYTGATQVVTTLAALLFLAPLLIILNYSFKTKRELYIGNPLALPESLNLTNYQNAYAKLDLSVTFVNTALYTIVAVAFLALLCGAAAWTIARNKGRFYRFAYLYFIIGILIPAQALFLPIYLVGYRTGLVNTRVGVILMFIATNLSFGVFLMTSFMSTVPVELEEAALMEGCRWGQVLFRVLLPMSWPSVLAFATVSITYHWNEYLWPLMMLNDPDKQVLTVGLVSFAMGAESGGQWGTIGAGTLMVCLPLMLAFILFQKQFLRSFGFSGIK